MARAELSERAIQGILDDARDPNKSIRQVALNSGVTPYEVEDILEARGIDKITRQEKS